MKPFGREGSNEEGWREEAPGKREGALVEDRRGSSGAFASAGTRDLAGVFARGLAETWPSEFACAVIPFTCDGWS